MYESPLPQRPLVLSIGGGKPYPYVLTLKGKPYPNRVNPHVYPYSTVYLSSSLDANDSHLRLSHWRKG